MKRRLRRFRCKAKCGLSVEWTIGQSSKDGKWKAVSLGQCKLGNRTLPVDFVPFELSNAVWGPGCRFDTEAEAEAFVRSL